MNSNDSSPPSNNNSVCQGDAVQCESPQSTADSSDRLEHLLLERVCLTCKTEERRILFLPCQHIACCLVCGESIIECPICRTHIIQKIQFQRT
ncbi:unnamed protein product [Clavelina lepadiformis]|uniref:RING-type domain-containing protein n=1 Tax=Clavelina lepadiformis TaxID=159417 RepID=A0ABP0FJR7_CLALP